MNFLASYKARFFLLCAGIPILMIISWKMAISNTIISYREYRQLIHNQVQYENPDSIIAALNNQLKGFQNTEISDPDKLDENLMDIISNNIPSLKIRLEEFPEIHSYNSNNYLIQTYKLSFSGKYIDLLRFIYFAESEITSCRIISTSFNRRELRKTGEKLFLEIYFQSVYPT